MLVRMGRAALEAQVTLVLAGRDQIIRNAPTVRWLERVHLGRRPCARSRTPPTRSNSSRDQRSSNSSSESGVVTGETRISIVSCRPGSRGYNPRVAWRSQARSARRSRAVPKSCRARSPCVDLPSMEQSAAHAGSLPPPRRRDKMSLSRRRGIMYLAGALIIAVPPAVWLIASAPVGAVEIGMPAVRSAVASRAELAADVSLVRHDPMALVSVAGSGTRTKSMRIAVFSSSRNGWAADYPQCRRSRSASTNRRG